MAQPLPSMPTTPGPLLDLDDMRVLVVLGEELHFGRAAVRLHLSQPGLSYRVKRMRTRWATRSCRARGAASS